MQAVARSGGREGDVFLAHKFIHGDNSMGR